MTDIRKGDLVRGTRKGGENSFEGRVAYTVAPGSGYLDFEGFSIFRDHYDIEVLDRPVDEELLVGAIEAYRKANNWVTPTPRSLHDSYAKGFTAVINFVNEYNAKESK